MKSNLSGCSNTSKQIELLVVSETCGREKNPAKLDIFFFFLIGFKAAGSVPLSIFFSSIIVYPLVSGPNAPSAVLIVLERCFSAEFKQTG